MTVTTDPAALIAAAARESTLGNYAYAAAMLQEAVDNSTNVAFTTTLQTALTTNRTARDVAIAKSHVQNLKGHDGTTLTG